MLFHTYLLFILFICFSTNPKPPKITFIYEGYAGAAPDFHTKFGK